MAWFPAASLTAAQVQAVLPAAWTALYAQPVSSAPADPATTASLTQVMMGYGVTFKPTGSGIVLVQLAGLVGSDTGLTSLLVGGRYGTGGAPVNGAAVTGTRFGAVEDQSLRGSGTGVGGGWATSAVLALTPGTTYWFDVALQTGNASDAGFVQAMSFTFAELPA
jgi:hypothetical protein